MAFLTVTARVNLALLLCNIILERFHIADNSLSQCHKGLAIKDMDTNQIETDSFFSKLMS